MDTGAVFASFFERSIDAVWLLDQQAGIFVDCNQAAVELILLVMTGKRRKLDLVEEI